MTTILIFLPGKSHGQRRLAGCGHGAANRLRHDLVTKQQQDIKSVYSFGKCCHFNNINSSSSRSWDIFLVLWITFNFLLILK